MKLGFVTAGTRIATSPANDNVGGAIPYLPASTVLKVKAKNRQWSDSRAVRSRAVSSDAGSNSSRNRVGDTRTMLRGEQLPELGRRRCSRGYRIMST
jgi:hypothetical protein